MDGERILSVVTVVGGFFLLPNGKIGNIIFLYSLESERGWGSEFRWIVCVFEVIIWFLAWWSSPDRVAARGQSTKVNYNH